MLRRIRLAPYAAALASALAAAHLALALASGLGACDPTDGDGPSADAGLEDDATPVDVASCPKAEPANGSSCDLPEGTTCDFGSCGTRLARCARGLWVVAGNPEPSPPCPEAPPTADASCPPCWPDGKVCTYYAAACLDPDASGPLNVATASCPSGSWQLDLAACDPPEGGGADVQGDSGPAGD
jgi:hypothetical protein